MYASSNRFWPLHGHGQQQQLRRGLITLSPVFIHLHKLFIFALLCFYLLRPKNFLNFALNFKICQYFFMLLLPFYKHTRRWSLKTSHKWSLRYFQCLPPATIEIEIFNVSCNFVRCCARFHYRQLQRIRWCSTSCVFFFFLLLFFCFFTGSQNERVPQRVMTVPKCSMTRQLQTYHTYVTFPLPSRTLSGLGQQQSEWKSNSKFKKREAKQQGEV